MTLQHLCWVATAAYAVHIAEEYVFHWRAWAREFSGVDVSPRLFFWMNALVPVIGAACSLAAPEHPMIALAFPALMLINATIFHFGAFVFMQGRYSPGLATAVFLFWPIGVLCFRSARLSGVLTPATLAGSLLLGALLMASPIVLLKARQRITARKKQ